MNSACLVHTARDVSEVTTWTTGIVKSSTSREQLVSQSTSSLDYGINTTGISFVLTILLCIKDSCTAALCCCISNLWRNSFSSR